MSYSLKNSTLTIVLLLISHLVFSQISENTKKAMFIINFAKNMTWPGQEDFTKYTFGVYGNSDMSKELGELASKDTINGKPISVTYFRKLDDITPTNLLYVDRIADANMVKILKKIKGKNTLLISNKWKDRRLIMINFQDNEEKPFEVNRKNLMQENLIMSDKILLRGGSEEELRKIYHKSEKKLQKEKEKVEAQKREIKKQQKKLDKVNNKMKEAKKELARKKQELKKQQKEIELQKTASEKLLEKINEQEKKLQKNLKVVAEQETEMAKQKKEIDERSRILGKLTAEIEKKKQLIKSKNKTLHEQTDQIEVQKTILFVVGLFLFIVAVLAFVIFRGYKAKKRINQELESKNIAISKQKTEIEAQAKELEKLSIVARETDNAVIIMDKHGNFEWVNESYTRMFGFTLNEMIHEKGKNIISPKNTKDVNASILHCINNKKTVNYQLMSTHRDGSEIWIQATLTPILDENNEIKKIIAIDSDISKIKEAEFEIQQQAEELSAQAEELKKTNKALEKERELTMGSIRYGLTIQNAILPLKHEMDKFFHSFIIFRPKDVVSGDFYWFNHVKGKGIIPDKIFIAAVDCTGHGVPGAFMSMIGNRLLNEIVIEKKIYSPSQMLNTLNNGVIKALKQDQTDNNDGMDVCLCVLEKNQAGKIRLTFAGAKRPLYYCLNTEKEIQTIEGTRKSIGGARVTRNTSKFIDRHLTFEQNDLLYLTSDGLIDQNAPNRRRFGSKRFLAVLKENINKTLEKQREAIEMEFDTYRQNQPQRDDVTVLGIKLI